MVEFSKTRHVPKPGMYIVLLSIMFEHDKADWAVVFNDQKQILGLTIPRIPSGGEDLSN